MRRSARRGDRADLRKGAESLAPDQIAEPQRKSEEEEGEEEESVDSLLDSAIDIDQDIAAQAGLLQSDSPTSPTALGSKPDPVVDREARKIEEKALKHGEIIRKTHERLRRQNKLASTPK